MTVKSALHVLGAGGHGRSVADVALCCGYTDIYFVDRKWPNVDKTGDWQIVAAEASSIPAGANLFVAIGDNLTRLAHLHEIFQAGFSVPILVHPSAYVSARATVAQGTVVMPQAVIGVGSRIGKGVIVNTTASIDHDCDIADGVHVSPGAHLAGGVHVGKASWIGIGAVVREGVRLGDNVMIGAGAVVVSDAPHGARMLGVPAREI